MKSAASQMKVLSAEYTTAATKAKLFGSETDSLKAKAESLTQKITVQKNIVKLNSEQQEKLTKKLSDQKTKQEELKTKIDAAKEAYEKSTAETGKNSEQSKALKEELDKLEKEFTTNETAIGKTETALANQTVKTEKSKTALMNMEAELKNVNDQLKDNKLEKFATACDTAGTKMESFGKKMSVVSAGIAGIGAASIAAFKELDEGYDTIVTKTGATGEALEGLTKSADNVFGTMPEDMSTVGEAIGEVNTRFHTTGTELEKTSKQFIQFATINGTNVTQSVDQVDKIMKAWNVDASQTGNLLGLLTAKAQETGISVDTLESNVLDNNAAFKEMGLSLPQAINLMAQFDANGVDSTQAMAGLKKALQNATAEGKSMDEALSETIGSIKNAKTETEAMQIATELFGKKGAAEMTKAIRENRIDLTSLSSSMEEYGTTVEDTYNGTLDPIDNAKVAMNNAKLALSTLASTAQTSAAPMIEKLTGKIQELTKWFTSLSPAQQETILKVGLVVAAIGPLSIGFGKVAKGISDTITTGQKFVSGAAKIIAKITAKTAATAAGTAADTAGTTAATATTGGMTVAQTALNAVMNLCPIILIVTLIAGLIAAGVALYKNWDKVKEKLSELWGNIKEKFNAIKETITGAFTKAKEAVTNKVKEIGDNIKNSTIGQAASKVFNGVKDTVHNVMSAATETAKEKLGNMKTAYEENGGGIKGVVAAGWEGIKGYYSAGFTFVDNLSGGKLSEIKSKFSEKTSEIKTKVSEGWENMKTSVTTKMTEWKTNASNKLNEIKTNFSTKVSDIKSNVSTGWENMKTTVTNKMTEWKNNASNKLTEIKSGFSSKVSEIKTKWSTDFTNIKDKATSLMETAKSNVSTKLNNMKSAYSEKGGGIKGIVSATFTGVKDTMNSLMGTANTLTGGKLDSIKSAFSSKMGAAKSTVSSVLDDIKGAFSSKLESAKSTVSSVIEKIKGVFNFKWSLPHLNLPHISVNGGKAPYGIGGKGSLPSFSIEWYKNGGIMTNPTVFGINGNSLMVGGEAGDEAILPLAEFYNKLNSILDKKLDAVQKSQVVYVTNHTYIDGDEIASRTVSKVDAEMVINKRKGR
jgi:phage-related minor tail protein